MKYLTLIFPVMALASCSATEVHYVNACPTGDLTCERNLNAQTLSAIGEDAAALRLLCGDSAMATELGDKCTR